MKALTTTGLTELITKIKSSFIKTTDVVATTTLDIETTPTSASSNLITSGGVYTAVSNKVKLEEYDSTATPEENVIYYSADD